MPHGIDPLAVRRSVRMPEKAANRLVALVAIDDVRHHRHTPHRWVHPKLADTLCVQGSYVGLLRSYLLYRACRLSPKTATKGVRLAEGGAAQVYQLHGRRLPLDVIGLSEETDDRRLSQLLNLAVEGRMWVDPDVVVWIERSLGRMCGQGGWEKVYDTYVACHGVQLEATA